VDRPVYIGGMEERRNLETPARERILLAAHDLFYREGVRATGVDRLIVAAGVTKVTFYRHFPAKNDLVRAFLAYRHGLWMAWFEAALERHRTAQSADDPLAPLRLALAEWFEDPQFRGCAFINAVAELGGALPEVREIAAAHKRDMTAAIAGLLPDDPRAQRVAQAAALAVDGAIVRAQTGVEGTQGALAALKDALGALATRLG